ncbi:hypothetical protein DSO57_1014669 [Entomophthora muscae]|uniref:Uncharacterized protein n=1 Tax=Entomophthora muscae TaxID=34485 RepID=A0ACC2RWK3_9FUNG|nr:hypothetical protein DSO57_1014669 [Entomophthora muscae]
MQDTRIGMRFGLILAGGSFFVAAEIPGCRHVSSLYCQEAKLTRETYRERFELPKDNSQVLTLVRGLITDRLAKLIEPENVPEYMAIANVQDRVNAIRFYAHAITPMIKHFSKKAIMEIKYQTILTTHNSTQAHIEYSETRAIIDNILHTYTKHVDQIMQGMVHFFNTPPENKIVRFYLQKE